MRARDFLKQIWPANGYYCIAVPTINQAGKRTYKHAIHDTMDDAYLDSRARYKDTDIYFGIFTHINDRVLNPKYQKMLPSRKRENMAQAKCLFLDLDVGKGKGTYATQGDALAALARFLFRTCFPAPLVVSSGNGLHVYWALKDPVDADDWKPHAANLRAVLDANHVMYDPSRTTDTTSVLRMPATLNHKDPADLKKVEVLFEGDGEVENQRFFVLLKLLGGNMTPIRTNSAPQTNAQGNIVIGTNFPATDPDEVADECAQVRALRDQNGNIPEPLWYAIAGILAYCTGGEAAYHKWSSGYPGYTYAEAQAKLEQWKANGSVTSCAKLNNDGMQGVCQTCPHWGGQFKNPVVIVNKKPLVQAFVPAPKIVVPPSTCPAPICDPPKPYARTQGLSVTRWDDVKNLTLTTLHEFDLYPISVSSGVVGGQKVNHGVSTWVGREYTIQKQITWRTFDVPNEYLSDTRELSKHMTGHGWFAPVTNEVAKYMSAYLRELKAHVGLRQQQTHIGWEGEGKLDTFVLNGVVLDKTGRATPCVMAKDADIGIEGMTTAGTLLGQMASLSFYRDISYAAHQFLILASLANPLLMATGHHGAIINASGESGASKTTTLIAASAMWGNPSKFIVNGTNRGMSAMARELRAMTLANVPTLVDEITHMDPEEARTMVMTWTQPELRKTLTSGRTVREKALNGYRSAYLLLTANSSLHQIVNAESSTAGTANSARVFQLMFHRGAMIHTKAEADEALRQFRSNYGWLGPHFMMLAMPTMDKLFDSVRDMVVKLDSDTNAAPSARFLTAAAAPVFVAGAFAVYHGLIDWDMNALYDWFLNVQWPSLVADMAEQQGYVDHAKVMRDFLAQHMLDTLVDHGQGNIDPCQPRTQLVVHRHLDTGETWIDLSAFRRWCIKRGTPMTNLVEDLSKQGVITSKEARRYLGEGTRFAAVRNTVIIIDTTKLNA